MVVETDSERVKHSRKMVLEFLGSGVDLDQAPELQKWIDHYGSDTSRYDQYELPALRMGEAPKIQDNLYIRDYDRCVLCYKCVEACGDDAQHTYAIAVSGRGFDARISTEFDVTLPDSACVYCATASGSARPAPSSSRPNTTFVKQTTGGPRTKTSPERSAPTAVSAATSNCTPKTTRS